LEALGCEVIGVGCDANGVFQHEPEPIAAHLREVAPLIASRRAQIGLVLDPDADRLALIDETGRYIGEELTLALATRFRLEEKPGPVVINMSTSRVVEDIAGRYGASCLRAPVGEANVVERMREVNAVFGGEGNGGVIDPRVGYVRDPFIGMGLVLNLLAKTGQTLSRLVQDLPAYTIVKDKRAFPNDRLGELFAALRKHWPDARPTEGDGLRLDWADRWLHVRPSNTEPIVRLIAEANQESIATELCESARSILSQLNPAPE
jgi:phosphomannomutase